ncbi:MAG: BamA/TamA family outer membrane protein [Bacteroidaceae bacterium]|nr:BamA/TamA family outer membrane protein [Bacteroidaceae bacterium]
MSRRPGHMFLGLTTMLWLASCSVYKYVPQGEYLLNKIEVTSTDKEIADAPKYRNLSYQMPNSRWFGLFRFPLRLYSLSGADGEKRINSMLRRAGEPPVVYDPLLSEATSVDMRRSLMNSGYLNARVTYSTRNSRRPKTTVRYELDPGKMFVVDTIRITVQDSAIERIINDNIDKSLLVSGMNLDADVLNDERNRIVELVHKYGYYRFNRDFVSFVADTVRGSEKVGLRMIVAAESTDEDGGVHPHRQFTISSVDYYLSDKSGNLPGNGLQAARDSSGGISLVYPGQDGKPYLRSKIVDNHSFIRSGMMYNSDSISKTYSSLSRLGILKYSNIRFDEVPGSDNELAASVSMMRLPKHSVALEVEGTNTAGDLGAAASLSLTDRNLFRGSEQLTIKLRGAYESISNLPGYSGDTYLEYGLEANLDFPEFLIPFMSQELQRRSQATSRFSAKINAQRRPEFQKTIFSAGWSYIWGDSWQKSHRLDVVDLNYLVVPWISDHFRSEYLDQITSAKSILKYNYEDLLITKLGYTYYYSNARINSTAPFQYTFRVGVETSGNMLNLLSEPLGFEQNESGQYKFLGVAFAQYVKQDFAFTANWRMDRMNNLVAHVEWGIAVPYGNSTSLPFEKRYFAGGANSVRGWAVRELGPGTYKGDDRTIDYIKQSGDIKLGASLEYRSKLFWKVNGAAFVDAGNIWTIRDYTEQPGGVFGFDTFYKQIAVSYGLGIRFDFGFLVLRLDGGMKAYNPSGKTLYKRLPLVHPSMDRDFAFHLAVGYPF